MSNRIITLAPASVARRDLYARMADKAYGDYLSAHIAYSQVLENQISPVEAWHSQIRKASGDRASSRELMRLVLELGAFRHDPADAGDGGLDPIEWYEKHLLGGL